jgi:hypothetical protein
MLKHDETWKARPFVTMRREGCSLRRPLPGRRWVIAFCLATLGLASLLLLTRGGAPANALEVFPPSKHALAPHHMPPFITAPGATDFLYVFVTIFLVAAILGAGVFFFWLHSLPERMVHGSTKVHFDIVAVLGLLALFTHIHWFWIAALLLALVKIPEISIPDFSGLGRIADAVEKMAEAEAVQANESPPKLSSRRFAKGK